MLKSSNYDSNAREARQDFKDYTPMEAQSFNDLIIQHMESIEKCIIERARHEQELQNRLKRLSERKMQDLDAKFSTGYKQRDHASFQETQNVSGLYQTKGHDQVVERLNSNVTPFPNDSPDMCDNDIQTDQNADDERTALANLIANLKLDVD
ncbi:hypothetical protein Tco_0708857 [Tanacetum coccineum]